MKFRAETASAQRSRLLAPLFRGISGSGRGARAVCAAVLTMPRAPRTPRELQGLAFDAPGPRNADMPHTTPGRRKAHRAASPGARGRGRAAEAANGGSSVAGSDRRARATTPRRRGRRSRALSDAEILEDDFGTRLSIIAINLLLFLCTAALGADIAHKSKLGLRDDAVAAAAAALFAAVWFIVFGLAVIKRRGAVASASTDDYKPSPVGAIAAPVFVYYGVSYTAMIAGPMVLVVSLLRGEGTESKAWVKLGLFMVGVTAVQVFAGFSRFAQNSARHPQLELVFVQGHSFMGLLACAVFYLARVSGTFGPLEA